MPLTVEQFTERLTESGLLPDEQLREFVAALPEQSPVRPNAEEFARELVRQKKLIRFQAEQFYPRKSTFGSLHPSPVLAQNDLALLPARSL